MWIPVFSPMFTATRLAESGSGRIVAKPKKRSVSDRLEAYNRSVHSQVEYERLQSLVRVVQWAIVLPYKVSGNRTRHRPNFARIGDKVQRDGNDFNFLRN
jgi:hypothetical protein